ncbi:MAG TPA: TonB-dependent receptor, partial [Myxococcota bacterium]
MTTRHWLRLLLAAPIAASLGMPLAAVAQDAPAAPPAAAPAAAPADAFTEEIIVTSRKREESVQDVPFAVSAKTGDDLREAGSSNLEDIARIVPSLTVQNLGPGQSQVSIRGSSAGQIVRDQPQVKEQVGIYLDESAVSLSLFTPDLDLFDLNRVEVLRGPQGTLFGAGSEAGTVRYITNAPNLEEVEGALEGGINFVQDGGRGGDLKGVVSLPLIEGKLGMRVAAFWTGFPGFIDAVNPNGKEHDVNEGDRWGFRASLLFQPTDAISITPRIVYQQVGVDGFNRQDRFNILANEFTTTRPAVNLGKREQFRQFTEKFTDKFLLADLNMSIQANDWLTFTSVTSFTDRDIVMLRDATQLTASITGGSIGLAEPIYTLDAPLDDSTDVKSVTQELRASGEHEIGGDVLNSIDWVLGYFYSNIDRDYAQTLFVDGFEALSGIPTAGVIAGTDELFFSRIPYDFKQDALFGETTWTLFDMLHLTAGVRWYTFEETRVLNFDGIFADRFINNVGTTIDPSTGQLIVAPSVTKSDGF